MTLVNMCGGCPHNPIKQTTVVGGAEVVPEWMQHVKNTFWNKPELAEPPQWLLDGLNKSQNQVIEEKGVLVSKSIRDKNLEMMYNNEAYFPTDIPEEALLKYEVYGKTLIDGEPVPLKEYMETLARYQNKDMLYLIGELPAEYRPVFEKMFDTLIRRMVKKQITSMPLS